MGNTLSCTRRNSRRFQDHSDSIKKLHNDLVDIIEIRSGLLESLFHRHVLTHQQVETIKGQTTDVDGVKSLLGVIVDAPIARQEQFLSALKKNNQIHIVNYIRHPSTESHSSDDWPLLKSDQEIKLFDWNRAEFIDSIDPKNGLLDELVTVGCINDRHRLLLEGHVTKTETEINEHLFGVLRRKSVTDYNKFVKCLLATNQRAIVSRLAPHLVPDDRPLTELRKSTMATNHATLVNMIDTDGLLVDEMYNARCITLRQAEWIRVAASTDRAQRLLRIVKRGIDADFDHFLECLNNTGQEHVTNILSGVGVGQFVVAKTTSSREEEERIVERLATVLQECPETDVERLIEEARRQVDELRRRGVHPTAAKTRYSIAVFFTFTSLAGLQYFYELCSSGQMRQLLHEIFTSLLFDGGRTVDVVHLDWNVADYILGMQFLYSAIGLPIFAETYRLIYGLDTVWNDPTVAMTTTTSEEVSLKIGELPFELVEMIVMRTAGQLFTSMNRTTPRAYIYATITIGAVTSLWWRTMTERRFNRRLLRTYFKSVCRPYKCNPQKTTSLELENGDSVYGMAEFDGKLYVVCEHSNVVRVFTNKPPFQPLDQLSIPGLEIARDVVVCSDTCRLYVAGWSTQCAIWRVNLGLSATSKEAQMFVESNWRPWSLSVRSSRLLITPFDGDSLYLYGDDGTLLHSTLLPAFMVARHAVETSRDTYFVGHFNRHAGNIESEHNSVTEVDIAGHVVRAFNGGQQGGHPAVRVQLNRPLYLLLDGDGHVIVADRFNKRIVLLDDNLNLKRVMITSLKETPWRLHLSRNTGLFFVAYLYSSRIDVFHVRN